MEIFSRDEWACKKCGDAQSTLHVHHNYYRRGLDPWEYPPEALVTLCESCHELETELAKTRNLLERLAPTQLNEPDLEEQYVPSRAELESEEAVEQFQNEERLREERELEDQDLNYNLNVLYLIHLERLERDKEERLNSKRAEAIERRFKRENQ